MLRVYTSDEGWCGVRLVRHSSWWVQGDGRKDLNCDICALRVPEGYVYAEGVYHCSWAVMLRSVDRDTVCTSFERPLWCSMVKDNGPSDS